MDLHIFWKAVIRAGYTVGFALLGQFLVWGVVADNWQAIGLNNLYASLLAGLVYGVKKAVTKELPY